jgi:hypothetical protein
MNFKTNLLDLIKDAYLWEYADISDIKEDISNKKPKLFFTKIQWFFILISIATCYFIPKGFDNDFAGYIISGLSLFIGILFTFVMTLYDKFKSIDFSLYKKEINEEKNKQGIRLKNFFKKNNSFNIIFFHIIYCLRNSINYNVDVSPNKYGNIIFFCI